MNPSFATSFPEFITSHLTATESCSEASVYAPGYIQPYGVVLVLQEPHLRIVQVSETVEQFLGIPAPALLGKPLQQLFPADQIQGLTQCLLHDTVEQCNPFELTPLANGCMSEGEQRGQSETFRGSLYRTGDALILELEPQSAGFKASTIQFFHRLQTAVISLRDAANVSDLAQTLARVVRDMTGFDRVMVYRFDANEHGAVIAEEKASHLDSSYLGLHYPAIDIPVPSRTLFLRNWVCQIPDVNATPAYLIAAPEVSLDPPLDLSHAILRGVSPCHLKYLQNMGVAGSLTISLISDQRLWGLISCHHHSPKLLDYETRKTCEFLGRLASIELVHQQERELDAYRVQIQGIQNKLQHELLQGRDGIQQVLTRNATELLQLVHAEGVAIALDDQIALMGQTPTLQQVDALLNWLTHLHQPEIYLTNCLVRPYPPARAFTQVASGILAISIVLNQKSYHLLWFRPEQIQTVNWAGNPQDAIAVDASGHLYLCPRQSFELWKETVRESSLPWELPEIEAARLMRNILMLAVLEFSQSALEQAAERAAIANRAKSQFLAKMSHELRTPLNAILGFTQLMNRNPNTPTEFQDYLGIISRSGEHLLTLINDVLEMSRIEAGQVVLAESHFNLHRLLRSLQDLFTLKASQKGLRLFLEIDQSVPHYVYGDDAKLRQILINLTSNAIKFTTQGDVTVCVGAELIRQVPSVCGSPTSAPDYPVRLSFAVKDTGCGIGESDWDSIFDAFIQTEQGRQAEGTGLGLSISRQFARLMGGDITVQSTLHQGSTFTCTVLLHRLDIADLVEPEAEHAVIGLESNQPTYRVLVVEDVRENRQLLETLLQSVGFEVMTAENGVEAIARWQDWHPDLILMDIQMPEMDGHETTRQIRRDEQTGLNDREAPSHHIPIIALTACAFEVDRIASLQAGCDDYITKPFAEKTLLEAIARQLGVNYRYAEGGSAGMVAVNHPRLSPQDLQIMPGAWIAQVHEAALDLNDHRLRQLVSQIPPQEHTLIGEMKYLVDNFQLDAIAALTQAEGADR